MAETLTNARGRNNYQSACTHLLKAGEICLRLDRESEWANFIVQLRKRHRRLPVLMEELDKAGL